MKQLEQSIKNHVLLNISYHRKIQNFQKNVHLLLYKCIHYTSIKYGSLEPLQIQVRNRYFFGHMPILFNSTIVTTDIRQYRSIDVLVNEDRVVTHDSRN